ncbi:hypothetical protein MKW98_021214 [Papaver atlanticum]|uniref:Uncharacterized protein n=1 Tax=Papaver atlanticum TaxID=357466 RepID=A0AAD4SA46_9MAGN|nr:hypothetical protein MKW98_021214 [Papaver atlanticum]
MENYQNPCEEYENHHSYESEEINRSSSNYSEFASAPADPWVLKKKKKKNQVFLEGCYIDEEDSAEGGGLVSRTMSLTDEDLDELKGCVDLGFGFSYEEIPELCNTLPALELCYSMSQRFMDEHSKGNDNGGGSVTGSPARTSSMNGSESSYSSPSPSVTSAPVANWKISSPGDHPEEVKARLKFWAQAVACTVKLCS